MSMQHTLLHELRNRTARVSYPLALENKFDKKAFTELTYFLKTMTTAMKYESFIEKGILVELITLINRLKNHQCQLNDNDFQIMALQLEKFFYLLISSETIDDRQSGTPRII